MIFLIPGVSLLLSAGGTAVFECEIDCKTLVWLKDNQPFDDDLAGRATQMSQGTLHRLEIADVKLSDAGVFTAHATLADGRITHCTANLIVQPGKNLSAFLLPFFPFQSSLYKFGSVSDCLQHRNFTTRMSSTFFKHVELNCLGVKGVQRI